MARPLRQEIIFAASHMQHYQSQKVKNYIFEMKL